MDAVVRRGLFAVRVSTLAFTSRMRREDGEVDPAVLDRPVQVVELPAPLGELRADGLDLGASSHTEGVGFARVALPGGATR